MDFFKFVVVFVIGFIIRLIGSEVRSEGVKFVFIVYYWEMVFLFFELKIILNFELYGNFYYFVVFCMYYRFMNFLILC